MFLLRETRALNIFTFIQYGFVKRHTREMLIAPFMGIGVYYDLTHRVV